MSPALKEEFNFGNLTLQELENNTYGKEYIR